MSTDGHGDGRKTGSLYHAMPEAGATMTNMPVFYDLNSIL